MEASQNSAYKEMKESKSINELSCGNQVLDLPHDKQFINGYSGHRFKNEESQHIIPFKQGIRGYTGSYLGKVEGKLGRSTVHNAAISQEENEEDFDLQSTFAQSAMNQSEFNSSQTKVNTANNSIITNGGFSKKLKDKSLSLNESRKLLLSYKFSEEEANSRGQTLDKLLFSINRTLVTKYIARKQMLKKAKNVFGACDRDRSGYLNQSDFVKSVELMGIVVPRAESTMLCKEFDSHASGRINYIEFLSAVGLNYPLNNDSDEHDTNNTCSRKSYIDSSKFF
jgi:hypothetical protein